jgi:hypothetical protein
VDVGNPLKYTDGQPVDIQDLGGGNNDYIAYVSFGTNNVGRPFIPVYFTISGTNASLISSLLATNPAAQLALFSVAPPGVGYTKIPTISTPGSVTYNRNDSTITVLTNAYEALEIEGVILNTPRIVISSIAQNPDGTATLGMTNVTSYATNAVTFCTWDTSLWQTGTVFTATSNVATVSVPATNPVSIYRVEKLP